MTAADEKSEINDALGAHAFIYDGLNLKTETISGLYNRVIEYLHESGPGSVAGRLTGLSMGPDYRVSYGYERGRINLVGWQIGAHSGNAGYVYENGLIIRSEIQGGPVASYARDPAERYLTAVKNDTMAA